MIIVNFSLVVRDMNVISAIVFDTVVCIVTLSRTLGLWRFSKRSTWVSTSFVDLLVQQSTRQAPVFHSNMLNPQPSQVS